jgi:hypothetical protein
MPGVKIRLFLSRQITGANEVWSTFPEQPYILSKGPRIVRQPQNERPGYQDSNCNLVYRAVARTITWFADICATFPFPAKTYYLSFCGAHPTIAWQRWTHRSCRTGLACKDKGYLSRISSSKPQGSPLDCRVRRLHRASSIHWVKRCSAAVGPRHGLHLQLSPP